MYDRFQITANQCLWYALASDGFRSLEEDSGHHECAESDSLSRHCTFLLLFNIGSDNSATQDLWLYLWLFFFEHHSFLDLITCCLRLVEEKSNVVWLIAMIELHVSLVLNR